MRYLLAIVFPPLAVAASAGFLTTMLNLLLCLLFWVPGMLHACLVVSRYYADERHAEVIAAITGQPPPAKLRAGLLLVGGIALILVTGFGAIVVLALRNSAESPAAINPAKLVK